MRGERQENEVVIEWDELQGDKQNEVSKLGSVYTGRDAKQVADYQQAAAVRNQELGQERQTKKYPVKRQPGAQEKQTIQKQNKNNKKTKALIKKKRSLHHRSVQMEHGNINKTLTSDTDPPLQPEKCS